MRMTVITVGGMVGAGKSTLAKMLAEKLGFNYISAGQIFREEAAKRGMTIQEFMKVAPESLHRNVDRMVAERVRSGNWVVDSRLGAFFVKNADLRVFLTAPVDVRAERVAERDGVPLKEAVQIVKTRDETDRENYRRIYGIDYLDIRAYDLVLNTALFEKDGVLEVVEHVLEQVS